MPFPFKVDCPPGHGGEPTFHTLRFGLSVAVKDLADKWSGHDKHYFKFQGENDANCIARHDPLPGLCEVAFHASGQGPDK